MLIDVVTSNSANELNANLLSWIIMAFNYLTWEGVIAIFALILSVIDLILHLKSYIKEAANVSIYQDIEESLYLSFKHFGIYHCAFVYVSIDNKSKERITISDCYLSVHNGSKYKAHIPQELTDAYRSGGLTLYKKDDLCPACQYAVKDKNLLDFKDIEGYGSTSGYIFFRLDSEVLSKETEMAILTIHTPRKDFTHNVELPRIPKTLQPLYPIK